MPIFLSDNSENLKQRAEQLSILSGQVLATGRQLSAVLLGPGAKLAGQIQKKGDDSDESA